MVDVVWNYRKCDFWGGRIDPVWSVDRPAWFDIDRYPMLADFIVRYDLGEQPRPRQVDQGPRFCTCNLAPDTDAIRRAGLFDVTFGHQGEKRGSGEDNWMIAGEGGCGGYAADAVLHHPVPIEDVEIAALEYLRRGHGHVVKVVGVRAEVRRVPIGPRAVIEQEVLVGPIKPGQMLA